MTKDEMTKDEMVSDALSNLDKVVAFLKANIRDEKFAFSIGYAHRVTDENGKHVGYMTKGILCAHNANVLAHAVVHGVLRFSEATGVDVFDVVEPKVQILSDEKVN